jgi:hypothetical protein
MLEDREQLPGERASETGHYEELNVFGTRTGKAVRIEQGETLPPAPRGFGWRRTKREAY